jgi:hypothetical protein
LIIKVNMARKFDARSGSLCRPGTHGELMNPTALLGSLQAGLFRAVALQVKARPQFWPPTGRLLAGPGQREHERETPGSGDISQSPAQAVPDCLPAGLAVLAR